MPPEVATAGCLGFIGYLFWTDITKREDSSISWVPFLWIFIAASRFVSSWLNLGSPVAVDAYADGSPVDRAVFAALILWGVVVLSRRDINWFQLLTRNKWLVVYFLYTLSSITWTDEPFVLFKRWVKDLGNPIMALVMLTEKRPYEAVGITLRRVSYLCVPLSVLFVKYFPELGRTYHYDGSPMFTGVGSQKNDLGLVCLTAGMYFFWKLLQKGRGSEQAMMTSQVLDLMLIAMLLWLLAISDSQTSIVCLVSVVAILLAIRLPFVFTKPSRLVFLLAIGTLSYFVFAAAFQIDAHILALLGRESTLTNRTEIWDVVRSHQTSPIIGVGFMSFWTGERMLAVWAALQTPGLNQAHNGYLEQYLNLGYVGVALIVLVMCSALFKIRRELNSDLSGSVLRLCLLVAAVLYNYTEASFYGINNMWLLLIVACLDVPPAAWVESTAPSPHHQSLAALAWSRHSSASVSLNALPTPVTSRVSAGWTPRDRRNWRTFRHEPRGRSSS